MDFTGLTAASWYPGHMLKAERELKAKLKLIDVVIELVDARCPLSSRNDRLAALTAHKARLIAVGKCDLAVPEVTNQWLGWFRDQGLVALAGHQRQADWRARLLAAVRAADAADRRRRGAPTRRLHPLRALVVGLPNVGKSTLINGLAQRHSARTGPLPGVTRQQQWVNLDADTQLLDTPGIMPPRLGDAEAGLRIGLAGCLKDDLVGIELLAEYWLHAFRREGRLAVLAEQGIPELPERPGELLAAIAREWRLLRAGGEPDLRRAAGALIADYRAGRHGPLSLERPPAAATAKMPGRQDSTAAE